MSDLTERLRCVHRFTLDELSNEAANEIESLRAQLTERTTVCKELERALISEADRMNDIIEARETTIAEQTAQIEVAREALQLVVSNQQGYDDKPNCRKALEVIAAPSAALAKIKADALRELASDFEGMDCTLITTETIKKKADEIEGVAK